MCEKGIINKEAVRKKWWGILFSFVVASAGSTLSYGQSELVDLLVDGGNNFPWEKVELPGTVCSDGSQYKFFVHDSPNSNNLIILLEGGGACWDYESCSGSLGKLGAVNPNGIADDYMTQTTAKYVSPIVNGADPGLPGRAKIPIVTADWDVVYMPYCTGDVHVGNNVAVYNDPAGANPPLTFHHNGFNNTVAATNYLAQRFVDINKLLVTGYSAGGVASLAGYHQIRSTMTAAQGYMLNDSGPLFPAPNASFNSHLLHEKISTAWNLAPVLNTLPGNFDINDYGSMTAMLAAQYPSDQLAYTGYSSDFNFSRFSYERFYPGIGVNGILTKWREDQNLLISEMDKYTNFSYHVPWQRPINDSHCSTIITFIGSGACPSIRKKKWWERWQWPWSQSWKCAGNRTSMHSFLEQWVNQDKRLRLKEPSNSYQAEDPGMRVVAPIINGVI